MTRDLREGRRMILQALNEQIIQIVKKYKKKIIKFSNQTTILKNVKRD